MATFDYLHAIWKNGPGVVSDAPDWVLDEIDGALPTWICAHDRDLVGVQICEQSGLTLGIFVSPSALGGDGSLEDSSQGSFIHVFATDHPGRASLAVDEVRELFESVYGAPLSDAAVRQQRSFMLLDFPFHRDLANDLFINKDRVEGGFDPVASDRSYEFEEERADSSSTEAFHEEDDDRPAPPASLSALLSYPAPDGAPPEPPEPDGLPFDQGLSYDEVIARLMERVRSRPVDFEPEYGLGEPPILEPPAVSPSPTRDAWTSPEAPPEITEPETAAGDDPLALSPLFGRSAPPIASPAAGVIEVADVLPVEPTEPTEPSSAVCPTRDVGTAVADSAAVDEDETEELDLRTVAAPALPLPERRVALPVKPARSGWTPINPVAGLLVAGSLVGGAIVFSLWQRPPVPASLAETEAPAIAIPEVSMQRAESAQAGMDGRTESEEPSGIDTVEIDAPELQPKIALPAIEVAPVVVPTEELRPGPPSIETVTPRAFDEVETDFPALAVVEKQSASNASDASDASDAVVPEVASRPEPEPEPLSAGLDPPPETALAEAVAEPEPVTEEDTSSAVAESARAIPVATVDAASEQSSTAIAEEISVTSPDEEAARSSTGAEAAATPTANTAKERQTKPKVDRRSRERRRVMRDFNRYR